MPPPQAMDLTDLKSAFFSNVENVNALDIATLAFQPDMSRLLQTEERRRLEFKQKKLESLAQSSKATTVNFSSSDIYRPLLGDRDIRVLQVAPGGFDDDIQCSMRHCSIDFELDVYASRYATSLPDCEPLWYTALSYVWGPPRFDREIICNGKKKYITVNLEKALRCLRSRTETIVLWVDQLCINQDDHAERAKQVRMMDVIYRYSYRTVIWIGVETTQMAFDILPRLHAHLWPGLRRLSDEEWERFPFFAPLSVVWDCLETLLTQPWFQRVWVIQETAISMYPHVLFGGSIMPWEDLAGACLTLQETGLLPWLAKKVASVTNTRAEPSSFSGLHSLTQMVVIKQDYMGNDGTSDLLTTLHHTRHAQASDLRDKIYGILGLCRNMIEPDYTKPVHSIYHDATVIIIEEQISFTKKAERNAYLRTQSRHLCENDKAGLYDVLCFVDHENTASDLPSWVPNWGLPRRTASLGHRIIYRGIWHAGGKSEAMPLDISLDKTSLLISGHLVDNIGKLARPNLHGLALSLDNPTVTNAELIQLVTFTEVHTSSQQQSRDSLFTTFWSTLVAGKDGAGLRAAPSTEYAEFFSVLLDQSTGHSGSPTLPGQTYSARHTRGYLTLESYKRRKPAETLQDLRLACDKALVNRRLCVTKSHGFLALVPEYVREGDAIFVFQSCPTPFVMRPVENRASHYRLIGECYVHSIMKGESLVMDGLKSSIITVI